MPLKMCKQGLAKRVRCKSHRWGRRCFVWSITGAQQSLCSRRLRCELVAKTHDARVIVVRICYTAPDEQKRRRSFCSTPRGRIERRRSSRGLRGCTARRCDRAFQRWKIAGAKQGSLSLLSSWGFRRYYCCFPRFLSISDHLAPSPQSLFCSDYCTAVANGWRCVVALEVDLLLPFPIFFLHSPQLLFCSDYCTAVANGPRFLDVGDVSLELR